MSTRVLVVGQDGRQRPADAPQSGASLRFRFDPQGAAPHQVDPGVDGYVLDVLWTVPPRFSAPAADFRQQVLNLPFAELVTRARPCCIRIETLAGCTLDLPRLATLFGIPVTVVLPPPEELPEPGGRAADWVRASLAAASALEFPPGDHDPRPYSPFTEATIHPFGRSPAPGAADNSSRAFDYALYEFAMRDHGLLWRMQEGYVRFFEGCRKVLDLGCGAGIFLGLLEAAGIRGLGVERSPAIAAYARELGFDVAEADGLDFLERKPAAFDGIYCSHLVEHLPTGDVDRLLALLGRALEPGGRAVLVFPDPESIRSQLLGFWRDPEHVRFYHPDLVELMARAHGMDCVWHSHRHGPRRDIVPFEMNPGSAALNDVEALPSWEPAPVSSPSSGRWARLLERVGLASMARIRCLERQQESLTLQLLRLTRAHCETRQLVSTIKADTRRLWQVNQTWAWEDNAVLVLRKPGPGDAGVE